MDLNLNKFSIPDNKIHHSYLHLSDNMSIDGGCSSSVAMQAIPSTNSSVASNSSSSKTQLMNHDALKTTLTNLSTKNSVNKKPRKFSKALSDDALAMFLMDSNQHTIPLGEYYNHWEIDLEKLYMGPAFAQGAFGKLYRGTYNGEDVAVKLLEMPEGDAERAQLMEQQFTQEVKMLAALKHVNIVRFVGACRKSLVWCIVTEYAKGGSVRQALVEKSNKAIPMKVAVQQALDVARGMEYVHGLGFIHRDLKSDNLLVCGDKSIKIADFGVARIEVKTEGMTPETGTYRWMAPEMIQHRPYNHKVDVYSFGIVLWELITGNLPFHNMTAVQAAFAVVNKGSRPTIPNDCHPVMRELITRCWDADPDVRPSFADIVRVLEHMQGTNGPPVGRARFRCCLSEPMTIG